METGGCLDRQRAALSAKLAKRMVMRVRASTKGGNERTSPGSPLTGFDFEWSDAVLFSEWLIAVGSVVPAVCVDLQGAERTQDRFNMADEMNVVGAVAPSRTHFLSRLVRWA
jgi:hypothetical protein